MGSLQKIVHFLLLIVTKITHGDRSRQVKWNREYRLGVEGFEFVKCSFCGPHVYKTKGELCVIKERKNREIRNICKYFSWQIVKLIRIQYGPYKLGNLKKGQIKEIKVEDDA